MREILDIVKNTENMGKMVWNRPVPVPSFSGLELTRTILSVPWRSPLPFKKKEVAVEKGEKCFKKFKLPYLTQGGIKKI